MFFWTGNNYCQRAVTNLNLPIKIQNNNAYAKKHNNFRVNKTPCKFEGQNCCSLLPWCQRRQLTRPFRKIWKLFSESFCSKNVCFIR